jgi:hypothetical protein
MLTSNPANAPAPGECTLPRWASLPAAFRLYLPKAWAEDGERRRKARVPQEIGFAAKPQIALQQIQWACKAGLPRATVLMDAGYGVDARLRQGITALGLTYVAGVLSDTLVFAPGHQPAAGHTRPRSGRRQRHVLSIKEIAWACPTRHGGRSRGGKARPRSCRDASRGCVSARPIATARLPSEPSNGSSSSGPAASASRPATGSRPCPRTSPGRVWSNGPSCAGASSATIKHYTLQTETELVTQ